jgi:hypothetical protein
MKMTRDKFAMSRHLVLRTHSSAIEQRLLGTSPRMFRWPNHDRQLVCMQDIRGNENFPPLRRGCGTRQQDLTPFDSVTAQIRPVSPKLPDLHPIDLASGTVSLGAENPRFQSHPLWTTTNIMCTRPSEIPKAARVRSCAAPIAVGSPRSPLARKSRGCHTPPAWMHWQNFFSRRIVDDATKKP